MRFKSSTLIVFLLFALASCSQSKKNDALSEIDKKSIPVIQDFFKKIQDGQYKTAVDFLFRQNENIDLNDSLTISLRDKFNHINETAGSFISQRLIRKKGLGEDLGVYSYLAKYDKKFYRFTFVFYNNGKDVKIYRFAFDDTPDVELEEAIKLYVN